MRGYRVSAKAKKRRSIPMTKIDIISGFLGAGKTTFANMLLRYYMDVNLRPVYIVNEFGQAGLDAKIIEAAGFKAVEIEGGCICCTLKEDIAAALVEIISNFAPTNIVFEPSGIFIFDNFVETLRRPQLYGKCEVENVFTVVDSVNFSASTAEYGGFIYNQIKNAGVILLSKLEKTQANVEELICDIKNINSHALIISKIWKDWDAADFESLLHRQNYPLIAHRAHHHSHLRSLTIKPDGRFTQEKLDRFLACSQSGVFGEVYRIKGVLIVEELPVLLNIAMRDVMQTEFDGIPEQTLTFIGQTVNKKEIYDFFHCLPSS